MGQPIPASGSLTSDTVPTVPVARTSKDSGSPTAAAAAPGSAAAMAEPTRPERPGCSAPCGSDTGYKCSGRREALIGASAACWKYGTLAAGWPHGAASERWKRHTPASNTGSPASRRSSIPISTTSTFYPFTSTPSAANASSYPTAAGPDAPASANCSFADTSPRRHGCDRAASEMAAASQPETPARPAAAAAAAAAAASYAGDTHTRFLPEAGSVW